MTVRRLVTEKSRRTAGPAGPAGQCGSWEEFRRDSEDPGKNVSSNSEMLAQVPGLFVPQMLPFTLVALGTLIHNYCQLN